MTSRLKKIIIIMIPIVILLLILLYAILYFTTDFLKSDKKLFLKYMSQNVDAFKIIIDNKNEKEYTNLLRQNKYESTAQLSSTYTENINTSEENKNNDINKININVKGQSDYLNNYSYKDININYNDSNIIRTEYIQDNDKYGLRFPNKFNQFLAVENHDLKQVAANANIDENIIEILPEKIEEYDYNNVLSFTDEELETLKTRYINIISSNVSTDKYSKQKNAMITIGEESIYTNAYSLTLTHEQANDIYIKILEQLKNDEIIINKLSQLEPVSMIINLIKEDDRAYNKQYLEETFIDLIELKIHDIQENNIGTDKVVYTVYQVNGNTVRTQIVDDSKQLTIDLNEVGNNIDVSIQNKNNNQEQENQETIKIVRNNNMEKKEFLIQRERILGNIVSKLTFHRDKTTNDNTAEIQTGIEYKDEKDNLLELDLKEEINLNADYNKTELNNSNSVIINNYEGEKVSKWISQVTDYLNQTKENNKNIISNIKKINVIRKFLDIPEEEGVTIELTETTEVEKNRLNAKFEFYTGKAKKGEEVKKLLEENKTYLKNAQVSYSNEGYTEGTKKLQNIKLVIEKDANITELADSLIEMIEDAKTYTVEVEKNSNGVINGLSITVNQ